MTDYRGNAKSDRSSGIRGILMLTSAIALSGITSQASAGHTAVNPGSAGHMREALSPALSNQHETLRVALNGDAPAGDPAVDVAVQHNNQSDSAGTDFNSSNANSFRVVENSATGTLVGVLTLPNGSNKAKPRYTLVTGNPDDAFSVDAKTGRITVNNAQAINFEAHPRYELIIQVESGDAEGDALRRSFLEHLQNSGADDSAVDTLLADRPARQVVVGIVDVVNVNEKPRLKGTQFELPENSSRGTSVGIVSGTDDDIADRLRYSIEAGNNSGAFAIDAATGEITVRDARPLDFEATRQFDLKVKVTDTGGLSDTATVEIVLQNVEEPVPVETLPAATDASPSLPQDAVTSVSNDVSKTGEAGSSAADPPIASGDTASNGFGWGVAACVLGIIGLLANGIWAISLGRLTAALYSERKRLDAEREDQQQSRMALQSQREELIAEQSRINKLRTTLAGSEQEFQQRRQLLEEKWEELESTLESVRSNRRTLKEEQVRLAELRTQLEQRQQELASVPDSAELADLNLLGSDGESAGNQSVIGSGGGEDLEDEKISDLRATLSDMFGVSLGQEAAESHLDTAESLVEQAVADETPQPAASSHAEAPPEAEDPCESVTEYMKRLLQRNSLGGSFSETREASNAPPRQQAVSPQKQVPSQPVVAVPSDSVVPEPAEEQPPEEIAPRHRQDPDAVRSDLNNLREVANEAARAAVAAHSRKVQRSSSRLKGLCVLGSFAAAATLFLFGGPALSVYGWVPVAAGILILVELLYRLRKSADAGSNQLD